MAGSSCTAGSPHDCVCVTSPVWVVLASSLEDDPRTSVLRRSGG